jgi:hypothetical protein
VSVELLSAMIAVLSLLGLIVSNVYTYRARLKELEIQGESQRQNDKIQLLRQTQSELIEILSEAGRHKMIASQGQAAIIGMGRLGDDIYRLSKARMTIASIDDETLQKIAENFDNTNFGEKIEQAVIHLGIMINTEMKINSAKKK